MTLTTTAGGRSRNLILTAMIFAVSMTFIDQTIISIAVPQTVLFATSDRNCSRRATAASSPRG